MIRFANTSKASPLCAPGRALYVGSIAMEYAAEASYAPLVCLRHGKWKYTCCSLDPEQLFDLESDPHELINQAEDPVNAEMLSRLRSTVETRWNLDRFDAEIRESQARRWIVYEALRNGSFFPWDYQPLQKHQNVTCVITWTSTKSRKIKDILAEINNTKWEDKQRTIAGIENQAGTCSDW